MWGIGIQDGTVDVMSDVNIKIIEILEVGDLSEV